MPVFYIWEQIYVTEKATVELKFQLTLTIHLKKSQTFAPLKVWLASFSTPQSTSPARLLFMRSGNCSPNTWQELAGSAHNTPSYLADTEHTPTLMHMQLFWVMGMPWCTHVVFILYGFLFECVFLTGLLMTSLFPGQGCAIRPYPGRTRREGGAMRKNEVSPEPCVLVDLLPRFIQELKEHIWLKKYDLWVLRAWVFIGE